MKTRPWKFVDLAHNAPWLHWFLTLWLAAHVGCVWKRNSLNNGMRTGATFFLRSSILVRRGRSPFGQHQDSRPLIGSSFRSMRRVIVSYSQPIRVVRTDLEHAQSDRKLVNRRLFGVILFQRLRFSVLTKRSAASGDENGALPLSRNSRFALASLSPLFA